MRAANGLTAASLLLLASSVLASCNEPERPTCCVCSSSDVGCTPVTVLERDDGFDSCEQACESLGGCGDVTASVCEEGTSADDRVLWGYSMDEAPGSPVVGPDGTIYVPAGWIPSDGGLEQVTHGALYALDPAGGLRWQHDLDQHTPGASWPAVGPDGTIYVHANQQTGGAINVGTDRVFAIGPDGTRKWDVVLLERGSLTTDELSSPAVGPDGTIYVGSLDTAVYAIAPDGTKRWFQNLTTSSIGAAPAVAPDGTIYVLDAFVLAALGPNGDIRWAVPLGDSRGTPSSATSQAPVLGADGTIYAAEGDALHAICPDGRKKWVVQAVPELALGVPGGPIRGAPSLAADGTVYVGFDGVSAVSPAGEILWQHGCEDAAIGSLTGTGDSPVAAGEGTIFYRQGDMETTACALRADGSVLWGRRRGRDAYRPLSARPRPVVGSDGTLYSPESTQAIETPDAPIRSGLVAFRGEGPGPGPGGGSGEPCEPIQPLANACADLADCCSQIGNSFYRYPCDEVATAGDAAHCTATLIGYRDVGDCE